MATLFSHFDAAAHRPAVINPATGRPGLAWWQRALRALWQDACQRAEKPGRVVPYY